MKLIIAILFFGIGGCGSKDMKSEVANGTECDISIDKIISELNKYNYKVIAKIQDADHLYSEANINRDCIGLYSLYVGDCNKINTDLIFTSFPILVTPNEIFVNTLYINGTKMKKKKSEETKLQADWNSFVEEYGDNFEEKDLVSIKNSFMYGITAEPKGRRYP